jgi:hypothetical protein
MAGREFARAHLFAGPHDLDRRIEQPAELLQIERRPFAEGDVEGMGLRDEEVARGLDGRLAEISRTAQAAV